MTDAAGPAPVAMALDVVYEDGDLLVVNKPAGMLTHPVTKGARDTLANGVAHHLAAQGLPPVVHLVHRLDRDTSGLVLVAKRAEVHARFARQIARRALAREYLAFVDGGVAEERGTVDAPIGRDADDPPLRAVRPDGAPARTRWRVVERFAAATLVAAELETGRTHQVRVHMMHLGHPLLGDRWYGRRGLRLVGRQALHAARIAFSHPVTQTPVRAEAPLPPDLARLREMLRAGASADAPGERARPEPETPPRG